jgi:pilus assembly protein FimV
MRHTRLMLLTVFSTLLATNALALGLGSIRTYSEVNQPFAAEVELLDVNPDELDTVKVNLASESEFRRTGSERFHFLTKLRFKPQVSPSGRPVIRITSHAPVREPYLDFVVEVEWPKGRLVKAYVVVLGLPAQANR